jgi:LmbE family N-acetylglucosaminyl deacetylase
VRRIAVEPPVAVVSPHLDDAVLGCGQLLDAYPGAVVVTLFAGRPPRERRRRVTPWDADAGFDPGDDVVAARRAEDAAALGLLGARPVWLRFLDAQYGGRDETRRIGAALARALARRRVRDVFAPLGLYHSDHRRARESALVARALLPRARWHLYADGLYAGIPGAVGDELRALERLGHRLEPVRPRRAGRLARKRRALRCYATQLRALAARGRPDAARAFARERFWSIVS